MRIDLSREDALRDAPLPQPLECLVCPECGLLEGLGDAVGIHCPKCGCCEACADDPAEDRISCPECACCWACQPGGQCRECARCSACVAKHCSGCYRCDACVDFPDEPPLCPEVFCPECERERERYYERQETEADDGWAAEVDACWDILRRYGTCE